MQGRYHYLRLNPLSVAELNIETQDDFMALLTLSGFPEPFFSGSAVEKKRWAREYRHRLIQEDLQNLENVQNISNIELMMLRLPDLVASPLSINSLREDLQVSHRSVDTWLKIFERLYAVFRLSPFGAPQIRAVKKEQKHYHYDWSLPKEPGAQFENCIAVHLRKWVQYEIDTQGRELELRYFRDVDGREVDFILLEDGEPFLAVECKWKNSEVSKPLIYFKSKFPNCKAVQLSAEGSKHFVSKDNILVIPAVKWLAELI